MSESTGTSTRRERWGARMRSERYRWRLLALLLVMLAAVRAGAPTERDPYWSARAGMETLQGAPLARPDAWSWAAHGIWYPNSPAWNVVLGLGWQTLGFWGLFWIAFFAMVLFFALVVVAARAIGARAIPTLFAFGPLLLGSSAGLSPRATIVVQSLVLGAALFAWWWAPRGARQHGAVAALVIAAAGFGFSWVGNWVHLSFMVMAAVVAGMWALAWWLTDGMRWRRRILLTVCGTAGLLLGCVLSPYGIGLTLERARAVQEICAGVIVEWTSVWTLARYGQPQWWFVAILGAACVVGVLYWMVRTLSRGLRQEQARLMVPLGVVGSVFVLAGFGSIRFFVVGLLLIAPVAAAAVTNAADAAHRRWSAERRSPKRLIEYTSGRFWSVIFNCVAAVLMPLTIVEAAAGGSPGELDAVRALPRDCRLFAPAEVADVVILMRPDVKVWIDGRADFYGRRHLIQSVTAFASSAPPAGATCVILPPSESFPALISGLRSDPRWREEVVPGDYRLWRR